MMPGISIVLGIRDRDAARLKQLLDSLLTQTDRCFEAIIVDSGSTLARAEEYKQLSRRYSFCRYVYSLTRGLPWNRSQALNTGIRHAHFDYLLTTDADAIFADNFVATVRRFAAETHVIHCRPVWLPYCKWLWPGIRSGKRQGLLGNYDQLGMCFGMHRSIFNRLNGFDENLEFWGGEDRDLQRRIMALGLTETWIDEFTSMYHQWHPVTRGGLPGDYYAKFLEPYLAAQQHQLSRNPRSFGKLLSQEDRPLFGLLREDVLKSPRHLQWAIKSRQVQRLDYPKINRDRDASTDSKELRVVDTVVWSMKSEDIFSQIKFESLRAAFPNLRILIITGMDRKPWPHLLYSLSPGLWQLAARLAGKIFRAFALPTELIDGLMNRLQQQSPARQSVLIWQSANRGLFLDRYLPIAPPGDTFVFLLF
jgi:glycosyltransferase involved in cell wall biosynthesis